ELVSCVTGALRPYSHSIRIGPQNVSTQGGGVLRTHHFETIGLHTLPVVERHDAHRRDQAFVGSVPNHVLACEERLSVLLKAHVPPKLELTVLGPPHTLIGLKGEVLLAVAIHDPLG